MDAAERARMEAKGYAVVDDPADWLGLDEVERKLVDFRVRVGREVRKRREMAGLSQAELATAIGSSPSRIAKAEGTADGIGLDLLMRAFFAARGRIEVIAEESPADSNLTPIQRTLRIADSISSRSRVAGVCGTPQPRSASQRLSSANRGCGVPQTPATQNHRIREVIELAILKAIVQEIKTMTIEGFRASLVRAGIVTEDGELTAPYKPSPRKRSPRKPSTARSREGDPGDR